jgi:predicted phage tail protein
LDAIWNSKLAEKTRRGFMRAGETGLEGAYIAMLNEGDPVETAAWAAGTQTVGSLLMTASGTKTGLGLTAAAAIGMTFHQMLKDATPGGKDYILESIETSYQHLTALLIAGGMATIAGMGRAPARFQQNMPEIADMLTAVPRGGVLSFISEMNDPRKDTETMELVYSQLARDPNYFGPTAARRLDRAARVEDVSIEDTINNLMEVPKFRRQVDELQQRRQADRERAVRESVNQMVPQQQPTVDSLPPSPIPQGANPLGVPEDVIMGAVSRAEQVPQGQAMANAEMAMSQQVADRILKSLDANPGKVPKEKEAQIRRLLADRNAVTPQTLEEINALLRSD